MEVILKNNSVLLAVTLVVTTYSNVLYASDVDCDAAVKNGIAMLQIESVEMKIAAEEMLNTPELNKKNVARCKKELKTQKGKQKWACQEKAKSFLEVVACSK